MMLITRNFNPRQSFTSLVSFVKHFSTTNISRFRHNDVNDICPRSKFNFIASAAEKTAKSVVYIEVHNDAIARYFLFEHNDKPFCLIL